MAKNSILLASVMSLGFQTAKETNAKLSNLDYIILKKKTFTTKKKVSVKQEENICASEIRQELNLYISKAYKEFIGT